MSNHKTINYLKEVLKNMPSDWLDLTTHRLDIYNEKLAKTQFLNEFEMLFNNGIAEFDELKELPTAYDYIRRGHPLSCILEWGIAKLYKLKPESVISFSSQTMPLLAVLRTNLLAHKNTQIFYKDALPAFFDAEVLRNVYGYKFDLKQMDQEKDIVNLQQLGNNVSTVFISPKEDISNFDLAIGTDFSIHFHAALGSILVVNGVQNKAYIADIQHVRRRETISITPANALAALQTLVGQLATDPKKSNVASDKTAVLHSVKEITGTNAKPLVASSGLSIQYSIMMGLIDNALENHKGKAIKFIVPPNCYGGTNDQARRIADSIENVEVVDLPVDGNNDMVRSIDAILDEVAKADAVPYIIAEIPTNPRVEVPDLIALKATLSKERKNTAGKNAVEPVFILDQTFCPNVHFLGEGLILSSIPAISYASGSKFPSGGKCSAGYCVANKKATALMEKIDLHLTLCNNEATDLQYEILAKQLPGMNQRIKDAYANTREFVDFIRETLPSAKINFVSEELAKQGFTPSVFSLDLPTTGHTDAEKEANKRALNLKLIHLMITEIPNESKFCVSYGQLKGCYWTVPATSTQGTTKEGDKDYIVRVAISPTLDLELHKKVFADFVGSIAQRVSN